MNRISMVKPSTRWSIALFLLVWGNSVQATQQCELDIPLSAPSSRFEVAADGTARDLWSGRQWQRCPLGFEVDGRGTGNDLDDLCVLATQDTWTIEDAIAQVASVNNTAGLVGNDEWRVANLAELQSITERACQQPALNLSVFPNRHFDKVLSANIGGIGYPITYHFAEGVTTSQRFGGIDGELNSVTGEIWLVRY